MQKFLGIFYAPSENLQISIKRCIFATNHWRIPQWRAGVTFEGKNITSVCCYSEHFESTTFKKDKNRRISRKRLCDMHGRDLSGFWGLW